MDRPLMAVYLLSLCGCTCCLAQTWDFEDGLPPDAVVQGDVTVQTEVVHGGEHALRLGRGAELLLPVAAEDGFGRVSLWVHDPGPKLTADQARERLFGPLWGLSSSADERLCFGLLYAPYLSGNDSYGWISTAENGWGSRRYARARRSPGWHRWVFEVRNETDIGVSVDGEVASGFDVMTAKFFRGFSAIYLRGAVDTDEPLIADDIEVSHQSEPPARRTRPLPSEGRPAPDLAPLALKPDLAGAHPRLFFSQSDIPALRARCATTHRDFFDRLLGGADSYLQQLPPSAAADCSNDQDMQQWGWWRLSTLSFAYVVTGEERYGEKAVEWLDILTSYEDWGAGGEVNQSMGAGNMLSGVACAYDWCYDLLSAQQRESIRDKLLRQVGEMTWAGFMDPNTNGYWKADHQNNHRHHRLCGLTLACLAILGECPEAGAYAAFAAGDAEKVAAAIPPDGSNHESPSYMAYGFSYVVHAFDALFHCTGLDLFSRAPGLANAPLFRAHVLSPGFRSVFNYGDGGDGTYYFNHYLFKLAAQYQDPRAQALMKAAYDASPESFIYHPWNILWYDSDLAPADLETIDRRRHFPDLQIATYRSSWTDPQALAVLLKCGPYGGHRLNELAEGWVNVAHDHPDANMFLLHWGGERWAKDDGYPKQDKAGRNHNIILVDGNGPAQRGTGWLQPIPNMGNMGRVDSVAYDDGLFTARGDATGYYPGMTAMHRWLAVIDDRYVVVLDDLHSEQEHEYRWLLHSDARGLVSGDGGFVLETGEQALKGRFALPAGVRPEVAPFELEGKPHSNLLCAAQRAASGRFLVVMALENLPEVEVTEAEGRVELSVGREYALHFDLTGAKVVLERF